MPDLEVEKDFYLDRVHTLKTAIATLNLDFDSAYQQGIDILAAHRPNYGSDGPSELVLIWWEWPQLH